MKSAMLSDPCLMETLGEAKNLLEQEKAKLEGREARCGAGCYFKVSRTMFPAKVGLRIQLVIDAFDAIPGFLQQEEEAAVALDKRMMRRAPSLTFRDDDRYVPLEFTESKVQNALDDPNGSPLVLLHGGPGKGKSTLARHVALHYHGKCKSPEENPDRAFELVAFLECGPKADIRASQLKLANLISPNSGATAVPEAEGKTDPEDAIWRRLKSLLKHQRILIVLDDVWEREFLQKMLDLRGVGVKFLVTSQNQDLCRDLSLSHPPIEIQMEDVNDNVAMQILASHVGFTDKQIPAHIQGLAHKVIEGMEKHPLALASVAKEIDPDRSHDVEEWEAASESFLTALQSRITKHTFGMAYQESFWLTTQRSIEAVREVTDDAPSLLILLHMCEAPSVPEEVLKILFVSVVCQGGSEESNLSRFKISMRALRSRGLVKISSPSQSSYSWSAHSLQKLFMEHEMNDEKETLLKVRRETILKMLESELDEINIKVGVESKSTTDGSVQEDRMVCIALCALYFHKHYSEKATFKMDILPGQLNSLRRSAIEPITRLLGMRVSGRWSKSAQSSAKQIYLRYIYKSGLHESGIVYLLALPVSVLPMLQALRDIAAVEQTTLIGENSGALLTALLDLLGNLPDSGDAEIATAAARVLSEFCLNPLHKAVIICSGILDTIFKILSPNNNSQLLVASTNILIRLAYHNGIGRDETAQHPGILDQLLQALSSDKIPDLQVGAARALRNLTASNDIAKRHIVNFPGLLESLVKLLSKDNSPDLQTQAAVSLANLGSNFEYGKEKIVGCPGAIQQLLASMSMNDSPLLQLGAAKALVNLSGSDNEISKRQLVDFPGLLESLVNLLSKDNSPDLQTVAAMSLVNLASNFEYGKEKIVGCPGAIQQLLASMSMNDSPLLQLGAAKALVNLSGSDNEITKRRLVEFPGLLESLVNLLSKDNSPEFQTEAAMSLGNLASNFEYGKEKIVACPGAIQQLLASMSTNDSPILQVDAAQALTNLTASANEITKRRLVKFPGLLESLVKLLSKDNSPDLQTQAAVSLANLASNFEYGKEKIVACPGAIQQLLASMSTNDSPLLQLNAAHALTNLTASRNEITKRRLVNLPGLLESLVNLFSKDNSPELQSEAAKSLGNLAGHFEYGKEKVVACPGAIQQLLASMSTNDSPILQVHAAQALTNLTASANEITNGRLVDFPGLLESLVNLLSKDNSPELQTEAAMSLVNLSGSDNEFTKRLLVNLPGILEELVKLLSRDNPDNLQLVAAQFLRNLANSQVGERTLTMMHCSGLLEKFFKSMPDGKIDQMSGWEYYVEAMTYIDPARSNGGQLHSAIAYSRRGYANMILGLNEEALDDLNRANEMESGDLSTLRSRCTVRTRLGDLEGALSDSNSIIEKQCTAFDLQESGVLKRMMGDLQGALEDLNRSLELDPNDYEVLKHRAHVRFLMKDENGAHSDAQMALALKPIRVDASSYGRDCLGVSFVEFLDYVLR